MPPQRQATPSTRRRSVPTSHSGTTSPKRSRRRSTGSRRRRRACAERWRRRDPLEARAVLYAVESGQPDVSRTKLVGLRAHYGFVEGSHATAYFSLHAELDREHAAASRAVLSERACAADEDRLVPAAEA